ncbi:hypothetical protein [Salinactinospora qingdaonensis]|uniref:Uncharacterized protein n=1 Tax=Salinactinospora qingdaonensis TaxID=702744 RepID=A0ABP7FUS9_9ACTN
MSADATPRGVRITELDHDTIAGVFADVFGQRRRCTALDALDPNAQQWLLAELGDTRITGGCSDGQWQLAYSNPQADRLSGEHGEAWRLLELVVFSENAQIRIGEVAEFGHSAVEDRAESEALPSYLKPRDRSFLLLGTETKPHRDKVAGGPPMTWGREPSGSWVLHPLPHADWKDFGVTRPTRQEREQGRTPVSRGSWLCLREYWAQDETTGAVHVAFHRLTGYHAGDKPATSLPTQAPSALDQGDDE